MMHPEDGVECCCCKVCHVSSRDTVRSWTTGSGVDSVVNVLKGVRASAGALALSITAKFYELIASAEHLVHLILQTSADVVESVDGLSLLASGSVCIGSWVSQSSLSEQISFNAVRLSFAGNLRGI